MNPRENKALNITFLCVLTLAAISSVVFFCLVESVNALHADDINFSAQAHNGGILSLPIIMYNTWQGRFLFHFINAVLGVLYIKTKTMLVGFMLCYLLQVMMVARSLTILTTSKPLMSVPLSMTLINIYYMALYDQASYFWLCTMCYHVGHAILLWGLAELYRLEKSDSQSPLAYKLVGVLFFLIGFTTETLAPTVLCALGLYLAWRWKQSGYDFRKTINRHGLVINAIFSASIAFIILALAPGNVVRMNAIARPEMSVGMYMTALWKDMVHLTLMNTNRWYIYLIGGAILMPFLPQKATGITPQEASKHMAVGLGIGVLLTLVTLALMVYAVGDIYIERSVAHLEIMSLSYIIYCLYLIKNALSASVAKYEMKTACASLVLLAAANIYISAASWPELRRYRDQRATRMEMLYKLRQQAHTDPVLIQHIDAPRAAWMPCQTQPLIFTEDVTSNTGHFINSAYMSVYELDFQVYSDTDDVW